MFGVKIRTKRPAVNLAGGRATPAAPSVNSERLIPARQEVAYLRQISFAIDQAGIQMAVAKHRGKTRTLLDARKEYFPKSIATDEERLRHITQSISQYLREHGGSGSRVTLSVAGPETIFRIFPMPALAKGDLDAAVEFEAKKQIPFPPRESLFDSRPVYRLQSDGQERVKIALHATTKNFIRDQLAPFDALGVRPSGISHTHDVIGHLLRGLPDFTEEKLFTLVNIERQRTELAYYRGSNLEFCHSCALGSSFLAQRTGTTVFEYFAESLAGEIQNSLDYYTGQYSSQFANRIYIYGDLSYSDELIQLLTDHFGFEFKRFPAEELDIPGCGNLSIESSLPVCLAAVASATNNFRLANLLPSEYQKDLRTKKSNHATLVGLIVLGGLLLAGYINERKGLSADTWKLAELADRTQSFKSSTMFDTYNMLKRQISASQNYLEKSKSVPSYLGSSLKELSHLTPAGIRLVNMDFHSDGTGHNLFVQGIVTARETSPEVTLAEFVENLMASPFYSNVTVAHYSKRPLAAGFEMDFQLDMRGVL